MIFLYSKLDIQNKGEGLGSLQDFVEEPIVTWNASGFLEVEFKYFLYGDFAEYMIPDAKLRTRIHSNDEVYHLFTIYEVEPDYIENTIQVRAEMTLLHELKDRVVPAGTMRGTANEMIMFVKNRMDRDYPFVITGNTDKTVFIEHDNISAYELIFGEDGILKRTGAEIKFTDRGIRVSDRIGTTHRDELRESDFVTNLTVNELQGEDFVTRIIPFTTVMFDKPVRDGDRYTRETIEIPTYGTPVVSPNITNKLYKVRTKFIEYRNESTEVPKYYNYQTDRGTETLEMSQYIYEDVTALNQDASTFFEDNQGIDEPTTTISIETLGLAKGYYTSLRYLNRYDIVTIYVEPKPYLTNTAETYVVQVNETVYEPLSDNLVSIGFTNDSMSLRDAYRNVNEGRISGQQLQAELQRERLRDLEDRLVNYVYNYDGFRLEFGNVLPEPDEYREGDLYYLETGEGIDLYKLVNGAWEFLVGQSTRDIIEGKFEEIQGELDSLSTEISDSEARATDKVNQALQDAKDWAEAEDALIRQEVDGAIEITEQAKQAAKDSEAKSEAIKQGLGLADPTLTNQQITDQIRQEFNSIKSTADNASQAFIDLNGEYQTFLTDKFNPAFTTASDALSLAEQNKGVFYSANLIDEVTGLSNVYTKAEIDGTNGYVTKATFNANAESINSEFERIEGVALASGANINLLITRNQEVNTWLDANTETRTYPTPDDTTNPTATSPDLISVTPGEKITLSKTTAPIDNYFRIDYLDADKKYVNRYTQNTNVATITIPENVAYLWVSYPLDSYPKIERGDVKTQWTLAPQDQVNQSTVNYLTSKIEQTPEMITDALTSYTKTDNLDNTVASYLTNTTTKTAGAIETKLSDYQTTSDLDGDIVKLLDNTTSQTAGKFNNKLQALEGKIPTEFGGRNLLRGTADFDTTLWRNVSTAIPSTRDSRYKQVRVDGDFNVAPITTMSVQGWNFEIGKEYVISVWAKSEASGNKLGVTAQSTPYFEPQVVAVSEWRRYVWKFTATISNLTNFRFETRNGERVWITQPQIEKGSVPTDWTRAVEDLATVVQTNEIERTANYTKSAITNATKDGLVTGSTVNQTKDGITERVARLDTNGNVSYSNRDVKLDSIVSTVANDEYISNIIQASDLVQSTIRENTNVDLLAKSASGTGMTADPNFDKGINGLIVYDSGNTNTISIYRNLNNDLNLPSGKGHRLDIYHASSTATSPQRGGVALPTRSWANGVVVVRFTARLDVGKNFAYNQNSTGTGSTHGWLTSNKGTGKWEQYAYYHRFGTSGTFQTFGFISVNATSAAFTWYLSEFDIINLGMSSQSQITQLQDNINLRVTKGDVLSQINIEAERTLIQSNKLVLDANSVVFTGEAFIPSAQIQSLDAGKITSGEIETARLKVTEIVSQGLSGNEESITNLVIGEDVFTSSVTNLAKQKVADELKQEFETKLSPVNIVNGKDFNSGETFSGGKYFYYTRDIVEQSMFNATPHVFELTMAATQNKGQLVKLETRAHGSTEWVNTGVSFNLPTGQHKVVHNFTSNTFATSVADYRLVVHNVGSTIVTSIYTMKVYKNQEVQVPVEGTNTGAISSKITQLYDMINLSILGKEGALSRIAMGEEGIQIDGKLLHITAKTYIDDAVIKSAMIDTLDAGKITTGELNASLVRVVNLDANSITGNEASFIKAMFSGTKSTLQITGTGVRVLDNAGRSSTYLDSTGIEISRAGVNLGKMQYVTNVSETGDLNGMNGIVMRPNRGSYFAVSYLPTAGTTESVRRFAVSGRTGNVYIQGLIKPSEQEKYGLDITWGTITGRGTNVRIMNHDRTGGIQIDNGDLHYITSSGKWRSLNGIS